MWHSEADIINDLAALNDFGEPGNTEPYKVLCSVGRGSNAKKKSHPKTTLDPRTGEEIEVGNQCLSLEDMFGRGKGRGASLSSKSYSLLQKQLRLARPLGSGDEIIEAYCRRNRRANQSEHSGISPVTKVNDSKSCDLSRSTNITIPDKLRSRVKAVRSSSVLNNALMSNLLKANEFSDSKELENSKEKENFEEINQIYPRVCKNGETVKSTILQNYSNSDDSSSWTTNEDTVSGSLCNSPENDYKGKLSKIKSGNESCKSFSIESEEDFININFHTGTSKVKLKHTAGSGSASSYCASIDETPDRNEIYRRLGEKLNKMTVFNDKRKKSEICFSVKAHASDVNPSSNQLVYDELNFPPLVKNS